MWRQPRLTTSSSRRKPRRLKLRRREWLPARIARRYPRIATCCVVCTCSVLWVYGLGVFQDNRATVLQQQEDPRLAARASKDVAVILNVIGHGVTISSVDAPRFIDDWAASYSPGDRRIAIASRLFFDDDSLLEIMGHECAHALFLQLDLLEERPEISRHQYVVHETAASVIGAHLAGAARDLRGGDGATLTEKLLRRYREGCRDYERRHATSGSAPFGGRLRYDGPWLTFAFRPAGFVGTDDFIDEMDSICCEYPEPVEAANVIAERFHNVDVESARRMAPPVEWRPARVQVSRR